MYIYIIFVSLGCSICKWCHGKSYGLHLGSHSTVNDGYKPLYVWWRGVPCPDEAGSWTACRCRGQVASWGGSWTFADANLDFNRTDWTPREIGMEPPRKSVLKIMFLWKIVISRLPQVFWCVCLDGDCFLCLVSWPSTQSQARKRYVAKSSMEIEEYICKYVNIMLL